MWTDILIFHTPLPMPCRHLWNFDQPYLETIWNFGYPIPVFISTLKTVLQFLFKNLAHTTLTSDGTQNIFGTRVLWMIPKTDKTNSNPSNMCVVDVLMGFKHIYFVIPNANPINRTFMSLCSFELYTNSCKHEIHVVLEILIFIQWLAFLNIRQEFILRLRIHNTGQMPVNVIFLFRC